MVLPNTYKAKRYVAKTWYNPYTEKEKTTEEKDRIKRKSLFSYTKIAPTRPEGTLVATRNVSAQRGETLRLQDARGGHVLRDLEVPERFVYVPADFPRGDPFNVGQMYALFAAAIWTG